MITIYGPTGAPAQVHESSVPVWLTRGWSTTAPDDSSLPEELHEPVASTQPSDVTAPGESEIEGVEPKHVAQDEE